MKSLQTKNQKNAGFTLVEIMVVILILSILLLLGNYGDITQRRERARLEELTVELTTLIDQQKVDTLLGKTEGGEVVRKRKMEIDFSSDTLMHKAYVDLAEDTEDFYCGVPGNATNCPIGISPDTPVAIKTWAPLGLTATLNNCDSGNPVGVSMPLTIELLGDTMSFKDMDTSAIKHIVIQLTRQGSYREIHIDRRTGMTFEREGESPVLCD